ncbi:MAG: hypothetical protein JWO62_3618 [Acidimicrobiaceae bacterium]|nr:hypothetical protein [Acidimicrobiaceae bacterium]
MPGDRTEATEVGTALGMLGYRHLSVALADRPSELVNIPDATWNGLSEMIASGKYRSEADSAFENGRAFAAAAEGLRGRRPLRIEWKGPHRPPGYDLLPADLRVDHVYLVSCKYQSQLLMNASPAHLFDRALQDRGGEPARDWYSIIAPDAYATFYSSVRSSLGGGLPETVEALSRLDRERIGKECARQWPSEMRSAYATFSAAVARSTADRWAASLRSGHDRELLLWRMLRLSDCPYFILGAGPQGSLRLRIGTPWDWRQLFRLIDFRMSANPAGQPRVEWEASIGELATGETRLVRGHVEVRWSHGRFCGMPEAKIYLDTPHEHVPGYFPLEKARQGTLMASGPAAGWDR